jgi:O-antigen/teichoic acid export membrane protein
LVILRKSAPFALLVLLMASYNRIDPILLRRMASDADAGIYAGAFRLLDALTMVAYLVSVPLLPVFSRLCRERTGRQIVDTIRIVFWPMMLFAVGAAVLCAIFAEPLMRLLYHDEYAPYVPVFRVVIFGIIPIGLTYIFGTLLTAGGHLRQLNIFAATTLVLNVLVNLLLIPRLGAVGSAWASLTAQSFMALAQLVLAIRLFRLSANTFLPPSTHNIYSNISLLLKQQTKE